jgi:hypothetical protein
MTALPKPLSQNTLYRFHVDNLREIDIAIERLSRSMREAIGKNDNVTLLSFIKLYGFLIGAWAECRLNKLLYEPSGFDQEDRDIIKIQDSQLGMWLKTVELAFRKHYNLPKASLSVTTLKHTNFSRYNSLIELLSNDLKIIIELRNKLAHAQWAHPLNNSGDGVALDAIKVLSSENLLSLQLKRQLVEHIANIVNDLVVSQPTFERDFDRHFMLIQNTKQQLVKRDYIEYVENIQERYKRGKNKRPASF